jgi:RimJ/RimL family protein N-acetyltransferase
MTDYKNALEQPIGFPLPDWQGCARPPETVMQGHYCRLEPLRAETHADDLYAAFAQDREERVWTYLPYGPFQRFEDYRTWVAAQSAGADPLFHAIIDQQTGTAAGVASYLRIEPAVGVIEVGHINYAPSLQKTPAATEAMYLMMRRVFDELGYRRYEWKCDTLNAGSRRAALRLGFMFEGIFRQATIYKGRNRDTAWYSIIDKEWPGLKRAFEDWLDTANFTEQGGQRKNLAQFISEYRSEQ